MKLEIVRPEDFISTNDLATTQPKEIHEVLKEWQRSFAAKQANARLNEWLSKNGKPVYACLSRTWFETIDQCQGHASHKAWLICEKIIEKCSHPKEKVTNQGQYVDNKVIWHCFICECGAKVQPKEFEEIK